MKSLISLLIVVLVVYGLSQFLLQAKPASVEGDGKSGRTSTSDAVRDQVNDATGDYQRKLEKAMQDAGTDG